MDQWLVRTTENFIAGPYSGDQIRQLIRERQLGLQDEICQANRYWISLHERDEIIRVLGAEIAPFLVERDDELTQTQTQTEPSIDEQSLAQASEQHGDGATGVFQIPKASQAPMPPIRRRPAVAMGGTIGGSLPASHVRVSPQAQRWKTVLWAIATLSALVVFAVLRYLRSH